MSRGKRPKSKHRFTNFAFYYFEIGKKKRKMRATGSDWLVCASGLRIEMQQFPFPPPSISLTPSNDIGFVSIIVSKKTTESSHPNVCRMKESFFVVVFLFIPQMIHSYDVCDTDDDDDIDDGGQFVVHVLFRSFISLLCTMEV